MKHIQSHLNHMLSAEQTTLAHTTRELLSEIGALNLDRAALVRLGRHVLTLVSADLKSGLHTQKAVHAAMKGGRDD